MQDGDRPILVYTTLPSVEAAKRVGASLVEAKLAACVNIFPAMIAIYEWQGKLEEGSEAAMLIKTRRALQEQVLAATKRLHPYETPALLVLELRGGSEDFCAWINTQTQPHPPSQAGR